jgi:hypothetical protein
MRPRYRKVLVITGLLFVASFLLTGLIGLFALEGPAGGIDTPPPQTQKGGDNLFIIAMISMFTSIGSAIAFVSTFILSWTKERRERAMFAMDTERKKLEYEKLALELEQMRKKREE